MWICLVTLISTLVFLEGTESALLEPEKQCVPTTTVQGPCHVCVCSHEGVFHCRSQECQKETVGRSRSSADCEPNFVFRQDNIFCRCSKDGFWLSDNCEATFNYLYPRTNVPDETLKTNIECIAKKLYLIDCNVCRCSDSNVFDVKLCTSRRCGYVHKAESCTNGDILRLENELCSCSDINYYIDRLCIKILDEVVQTLEPEDVIKLVDIGRTWRLTSDLSSDVCDSNLNYTVDCTDCVCKDGHLVCTKNVCEEKTKRALRQERVNEIDYLPELESDVGTSCEPGKMYRYKCNVCTCTKDGSPSCTTMHLTHHITNIAANVTKEKVKLPEIKYGEKCTYGKKYRMDCNTCHCGHQNNLLCTKAACLHPMDPETSEHPRVDKRSVKEFEAKKSKKKKAKKTMKRENIPLKTDKSAYPALPPSKICFPGRIYQEGCQRCYCKSDQKPACSTENACKEPKVTRDLRPVDVRSPISDEELKNLPILPHAASPCTQGTTYKVDCNTCVCDEFQNLLCDKLLCVSYADMHRAEALRNSGLPCNGKNFVENDVIQSKCVECICNGTTYCHAKEGCMAEAEQIMRTFGSRKNDSSLAFDYTADKCLPEHIYKDNCNKCYCQKDQTLRCTQKTCLNYKQAVILDKQQKYLQQHGL